MNLRGNVIGALSFGDTKSQHGGLLRKAYFAIGYNTTFPVNLMLAVGAMTPYLLYLAAIHELNFDALASAIVLTLVSAYFYNLVYIVNDMIDRRKDERLSIPKQTARHVLGESYLVNLAVCYVVVTVLVGAIWHAALIPLFVYGLALMALSVFHSNAGKLKPLTVFVERWAKFCAPMALIYIATGNDEALPMLAAAMFAYPVGFTFDYAYRGYLKDRLKMGSSARIGLYAAYWFALLSSISFVYGASDLQGASPMFGFFMIAYFLTVTVTYLLSNILPFGFLDKQYNKHVAGEKRLLLTYGLVQMALIIAGAAYAVLT